MEVARLYGPDGMPIMSDLQLEAEILGCELMWGCADNPPPPSPPTPSRATTRGIPLQVQDAHPESGRIPVMLEAMTS